MKPRHLPLWTRILLLAMLNLVLLAGVFVVFLRSQLQPDLESFLMAGARARISTLSAQVAADLQTTDSGEWEALFERYSQANGVQVMLYRNTREQLAGPRTAIPAQVESRMPPRPRAGRGGPPPDGGDRGFGPRGNGANAGGRRGPPRGEFGGRGGFDDGGGPRESRGSDGPPPPRGEFGERGGFGRGMPGDARGGGPGGWRGEFGERGDFGGRGNPGDNRGGGPPRNQGGGGGPDNPDAAGRPFLVVSDTLPKYWMGMRMPVVQTTSGEQLFSVLVLASNSFFLNPFFFEAHSWIGLGTAAVLLSVLCWLPLVRNITRSVSDMMRATGRIADGRYDVEVSTGRRDELGKLGSSIKQLASRLEIYTTGRTRFLGSVAHELRSPIARMQLAAEILERSAAGSADQKYIDYLKEDIQTMSRLTDELLQVARAESAPGPVRVQSIPIAEAVDAAVRREKTDGADVRVDVDAALNVMANSEYLVRAMGNIIRNGIRYAAQHGPITISAARSGNEVKVVIADSGPGVPMSDLDKIFMPFYRVDDARDRRTGGTGLGLAIVRSCVEACGGKVAAQNRQPSGLEVVITLPCA